MPAPETKIVQGKLDLSQWNINKQPIVGLSGEWQVEVLTERKWPVFGKNEFFVLPGSWADKRYGGKFPDQGVLAYRAQIRLPTAKRSLSLNAPLIYCAYEIYINGKLTLSRGRVGFSREEELFSARLQYILLSPETTEIEIVIIHSAHNFRYGIIDKVLELGTTEYIANRSGERTMADYSIFGFALVMMLYHLVLFALRPKEKSTLYFSLLCVVIILRILFSSGFSIQRMFPELSFVLQIKLDYFSLPLTLFASALFCNGIFPRSYLPIFRNLFIGISIPAFLLIAFTPPHIFSHASLPLQGIIGLDFLAALGASIHAVYQRTQGAKTFLLGFCIMFFGFANDVLLWNGVINSIALTGLAFCLFFFSQAILISMRFSAAFNRSEELGENLVATNAAYSRFVPKTFLENLGHSDISQVKLGDQVQKEMTILFSDIRSFTALSENMSPQENFNFLNSYLKRMSPIIQQNNGFIDKYIGDAIMALFPKTGEDGVRAAVGMVSELSTYNLHRMNQGYQPIEIGVGLHTGRLILGTIGSEDRMDGTVISDSVNLASRVEGLTKFYGASIVISETTFSSVSDPTIYEYRVLDRVVVKGKSDSVTVFEIFNGLPQAKIDLRLKTKGNFERGINYYMLEEFREAETSFRLVLLDDPTDKAAEIYLKRCAYYLEHGVPEEWQAITNLDHK